MDGTRVLDSDKRALAKAGTRPCSVAAAPAHYAELPAIATNGDGDWRAPGAPIAAWEEGLREGLAITATSSSPVSWPP